MYLVLFLRSIEFRFSVDVSSNVFDVRSVPAGSDTVETRLSKEKLARSDVSFVDSARSRFATISLDLEFRVASPLERLRIRTTNRDRFVRFSRAYLSAVDA